ncbi:MULTISPECIES: hypothetical protein [Shewanella]|uniref:Uncharacterized protein n=1 Tax=Shewanella fidelis TaxID=173509 RepID=A0AAW8NTF3_9GAMM|nr:MULTISPECIES: hypothetical protein [Shewanella]MDR8525530.1 hypothetical protein [Shewanella fidelis]MDW4813151.1 hypothetical protein [Shewanella fidelis]MDW4816969.1 hypothetical protein [Shewanella fidelis]MDW4820128.1 hypothetical protein [Shewanella fidelis]MDW4825616.1 hypothetical protein [Shewanella fidelis]
MTKSLSQAALLTAGLLLSSASVAAMDPIAKCNDCSSQAALQTATELENSSVYVVDFVNRTAKKFVTNDKGDTLLTKLSIGELNQINQKYDYRKTYLRAVQP